MLHPWRLPIVLPELRVSHCIFENCYSETDGGAIDAYKIRSVFEHVRFRNNRANRNGGAFHQGGRDGPQAVGGAGARACTQVVPPCKCHCSFHATHACTHARTDAHAQTRAQTQGRMRGRTGGWADGPTDRQTDRQTDGRTDRHTDRQTERQPDARAWCDCAQGHVCSCVPLCACVCVCA